MSIIIGKKARKQHGGTRYDIRRANRVPKHSRRPDKKFRNTQYSPSQIKSGKRGTHDI